MLSLRGPDPWVSGYLYNYIEAIDEETQLFEKDIARGNRDFEKARKPGQALAGQEWTVATLRTGRRVINRDEALSYQSGKTYQLRGPYGTSLSSDERQAILDILASRNLRFMEGGDDFEVLNFLPVVIVNIIKSYCETENLDPSIFRLDPATGEMESVAGLANQNPQNHQDTISLRTGNLLRHEYEPTVRIYIETPGLNYWCYRVKRCDTVQNIRDQFVTDSSSDTRNSQLELGRRVLDDGEIFGDVFTRSFVCSST